jgi:DNA gyrase subunit B
MQGKPLNASKADQKKVSGYALFAALIDAMGTGMGDAFDTKKLRYERVLLLMDPDADGVHCGVLMLMFFYRWMRPLLDAGGVSMVRAPVGEAKDDENGNRVFAYTDAEFQVFAQEHRTRGATVLRYRGLAGINVETLAALCVAPATRRASVISEADAKAAIDVFAGA